MKAGANSKQIYIKLMIGSLYLKKIHEMVILS